MPNDQTTITIWWQGLLAMFYGGITEELMVRLFGMTLIVWLLTRITKKEKKEIPDIFYYIAIFLTAILFGLGHLPATIQVFGELTSIIVTRALVFFYVLFTFFIIYPKEHNRSIRLTKWVRFGWEVLFSIRNLSYI